MGSKSRIWTILVIISLPFFMIINAIWLFAVGRFPQHWYPYFRDTSKDNKPDVSHRDSSCGYGFRVSHS